MSPGLTRLALLLTNKTRSNSYSFSSSSSSSFSSSSSPSSTFYYKHYYCYCFFYFFYFYFWPSCNSYYFPSPLYFLIPSSSSSSSLYRLKGNIFSSVLFSSGFFPTVASSTVAAFRNRLNSSSSLSSASISTAPHTRTAFLNQALAPQSASPSTPVTTPAIETATTATATATMDKMHKFRRKPKPPAIETSVDRNTGDTAQQLAANEATSPPQLQHPQKPSKIAALRNLRLRGTAKRARDDPPAELPSSPPPAVVTQDGMSPRRASRPSIQPEQKPDRNKKNFHLPPPKLPTFLTLSSQEIENKFQEITWAERNRIAQGLRNENIPDYPWTLYKQEDAQQRGVMDRYINIRPWSHNRVKLRVPQNEPDYVNASTVVLKSPSDKTKTPLRYIAMQGPTEPSFDYVWRMISEQISSPAVIVQLTSMFEAGSLKCDQYFPFDEEYAVWDLNEDNLWGDNWKAQLTYDSLEELSSGAIEKRKLLLHVEGEKQPRVIWHLLYRRWPDFGVPNLEDLDSFFELMKLSRKLSNPTSARVIHCSAGVGRTGTFICLEHLIRELESGALERHDSLIEGPDLIYETVEILRQQRRAMVQADVQYKFIYQVMRKLWQDKYGATDEDASSREPAAKRLEVADHSAGNGSSTGRAIGS